MLKNRPLRIFFPKMSAYGRDFDKTKCMSVSIKMRNDKLLEKYNKIWKKVSDIIQKKIGSNLAYNQKS